MDDKTWERYGSLGGVWFVVVAVIGGLFAGSTPSRSASVADIAKYYTDNDTGLQVGATIGNILWFIPGLFLALSYAISGVLLYLTIIGIPFGIQSFKFEPLALFPFGKEIVSARDLRDDIGIARATASRPPT